MIRAIISIEDRRFLEHDGVDWKGTLRAALKNSSSGEVQQGASTLDQQYIKNYQLLVLARTEAERELELIEGQRRTQHVIDDTIHIVGPCCWNGRDSGGESSRTHEYSS
jgi:hypothetical protein